MCVTEDIFDILLDGTTERLGRCRLRVLAVLAKLGEFWRLDRDA
jgi:hypothetical protein